MGPLFSETPNRVADIGSSVRGDTAANHWCTDRLAAYIRECLRLFWIVISSVTSVLEVGGWVASIEGLVEVLNAHYKAGFTGSIQGDVNKLLGEVHQQGHELHHLMTARLPLYQTSLSRTTPSDKVPDIEHFARRNLPRRKYLSPVKRYAAALHAKSLIAPPSADTAQSCLTTPIFRVRCNDQVLGCSAIGPGQHGCGVRCCAAGLLRGLVNEALVMLREVRDRMRFLSQRLHGKREVFRFRT